MILSWTLVRDREVVSYLHSLRDSGRELRMAIQSLERGVPSHACKVQDVPETWEWVEARYWITFIVNRERLLIYVADVMEVRL